MFNACIEYVCVFCPKSANLCKKCQACHMFICIVLHLEQINTKFCSRYQFYNWCESRARYILSTDWYYISKLPNCIHIYYAMSRTVDWGMSTFSLKLYYLIFTKWKMAVSPWTEVGHIFNLNSQNFCAVFKKKKRKTKAGILKKERNISLTNILACWTLDLLCCR